MLLDDYGLIVSKTWANTPDSGDSLAETGRIYFLKALCGIVDDLQPFANAVEKLKNDKGEWIRSPSQWTDPKDVSRDQIDPMIMALAIYNKANDLASEFNKLKDRKGLYPNGDVGSPEHLSHYIRHNHAPKGLKKLVTYFLFLLGDIFMLINTLLLVYIFPHHIEDDLNHIISQCFAQYFGPTWISKLAARIYLAKRPYKLALLQYYTPETGNGDLVDYYLKGLNWLKGRL